MDLGLDHEKAVENMRLLSFCSLALESDDCVIEYKSLADTLQIEKAQVEVYIVEAIRQKMIDCKIDQCNERVVVHSVMQRKFGDEQWAELQTRLHSWKEHAQSLLDVVKRQRDSVRQH